MNDIKTVGSYKNNHGVKASNPDDWRTRANKQLRTHKHSEINSAFYGGYSNNQHYAEMPVKPTSELKLDEILMGGEDWPN